MWSCHMGIKAFWSILWMFCFDSAFFLDSAVALVAYHHHILKVQVASWADVDRHCGRGEPQVHLSLPFMCSTEALGLFVDHSVMTAD